MRFFALFALATALAAPKAPLVPPAGNPETGQVAGRVELLTGEPLPRGCRVHLAPPTPANLDRVDTGKRLADMALEAQPNEQGFFQFTGVKPGIYTLRAEHQDFAPAEDSPIVVRAGLETELSRPLTLRPLAVLTVQVDPPLDPFDRRWRLQLNSEVTSKDASRSGVADDSGAWRQRGLLPGRWHLSVLGAQEGIWADQPIEIDAADQFAAVEVDVVAIEGRAFQGEEPFRGTLWFGGTHGSRRIRFDPDENGKFLGLLPGVGEWDVEVKDPGAGLDRLSLEPVTVRRRPGQSKARVEIHVPDTRLEGRVIDEAGKGIAATLLLIAAQHPSFARSGDDGHFLLRGLRAGTLLVQAETEDRVSDTQQVMLDDGRTNPEVTLVVRNRTHIRGIVRSAGGPLPGAEIFLWPALDQAGMGAMVRAVSGPEGSFEIAISGASRTVDVLANAPGYGISLSRRSVPSEGPLVLDLETAVGELDLTLAPSGKGSLPQGLLVHRGAFVPAAFLSRWGTLDTTSGHLLLSAVESGDWALCRNLAAVRDTTTGSSVCTQGVLFPGSRLALQAGAR